MEQAELGNPVPPLAPDGLIDLANRETQQQAARLVQEAFAAAFRCSLEGGAEQRQAVLQKLAAHLGSWAEMTERGAIPLRRALLLAGLDQWGLAFTECFGPAGMQGLSELMGGLRNDLSPMEEGQCQHFFDRLLAEEGAAFDFKVLLRRELHLAVWYAMLSCETTDEAEQVAQCLGSLLLSLLTQMPTQGWRLVADALASIQMRCLSQGLAAEGVGQVATQRLFAAVAAALPDEVRELVLQQSTSVVQAWQMARNATRQ